MVWFGVVWCGVVWCVVWCGVVWFISLLIFPYHFTPLFILHYLHHTTAKAHNHTTPQQKHTTTPRHSKSTQPHHATAKTHNHTTSQQKHTTTPRHSKSTQPHHTTAKAHNHTTPQFLKQQYRKHNKEHRRAGVVVTLVSGILSSIFSITIFYPISVVRTEMQAESEWRPLGEGVILRLKTFVGVSISEFNLELVVTFCWLMQAGSSWMIQHNINIAVCRSLR